MAKHFGSAGEFLTAGEAEEYTGLHRKLLARLAKAGDIIGHQPVSRGHWRYQRASLDAYLERITQPQPLREAS